jgi:hypothetical protein
MEGTLPIKHAALPRCTITLTRCTTTDMSPAQLWRLRYADRESWKDASTSYSGTPSVSIATAWYKAVLRRNRRILRLLPVFGGVGHSTRTRYSSVQVNNCYRMSAQVKSHTRHRPLAHGSTVRSSGRFPPCRHNKVGSNIAVT